MLRAPSTTARFVRILATESNPYGRKYYVQIAEVEVLEKTSPLGAIEIRWSAPGDDGMVGTADRYDIRYAEGGSIVFGSAIEANGEPSPAVAGTNQSYRLTGLLPDTTYTIALQSIDNADNESPVSARRSG